jgi:hypothetical protein
VGVAVSATAISIISPFGKESVYDFVPDFGVGAEMWTKFKAKTIGES